MRVFGFEHNSVFDPCAHGIDNSHCKSLHPKTEYRDYKTGQRVRRCRDDKTLLGFSWEGEENGKWVDLTEIPDYMEYVLMDDDSDAAYYLHCMSERHGERVSTTSVMKLEEPLRSAVLHWAGIDRTEQDVSNSTTMWISEEYGLVVTACQMWAYIVLWVSVESLVKVHEVVRQMKNLGIWEEPHPNGATMVLGR